MERTDVRCYKDRGERAALAAGTFNDFYREFIANYVPSKKVLSERETAKLER